MGYWVLDEADIREWSPEEAQARTRRRQKGERVTTAQLHEEWQSIHRALAGQLDEAKAESARLARRTAELAAAVERWMILARDAASMSPAEAKAAFDKCRREMHMVDGVPLAMPRFDKG